MSKDKRLKQGYKGCVPGPSDWILRTARLGMGVTYGSAKGAQPWYVVPETYSKRPDSDWTDSTEHTTNGDLGDVAMSRDRREKESGSREDKRS